MKVKERMQDGESYGWVNVPLKRSLIRGLKMGCVVQDMTLRATVEAIVTKYVEDVEKAIGRCLREKAIDSDSRSVAN